MKRCVEAVELLLLRLLEECMDGHVMLISGRVRERPVAKIHEVLTIAGKSGRQAGASMLSMPFLILPRHCYSFPSAGRLR